MAGVADLLSDLGYPATRAQALARLERIADDPAYLVLVADRKGSVVGLVAAHVLATVEHDEPVCQVIALVVASEYRRHGIGAELMAAVEARAKAAGCGLIVLSSGEWRGGAHAFYERLEFESTGRRYRKVLQ